MKVFMRSVGGYLPPHVVSNEDIVARTGGTAQWVEEHTGIRQRHFVLPGTANSTLAEHAARTALKRANIQATDLDAIVYATLSPDAGFPGSGVFLQRLLDVPNIPAIDIRNQCSGFLYGLSIARAWLSTGTYHRILLVGSEIQSTGLDFTEAGRTLAALFGDGAGAVVLTHENIDTPDSPSRCNIEIVDVRLGADGRGIEHLWCELPASGLHPNIDASYLAEGRQFPRMQGRTMFRRAVETLEREIGALIQSHQLDPDDLLLVPHQANKHINAMVAERLKIPAHNLVSTIEDYGNTTAASLPLGLERAWAKGLLQPGRPIVLAAFGSGYTWGTALLRGA